MPVVSYPPAMLDRMSWSRVSTEEPDLADRVRQAFATRKHATLATLRRDGAPRISGTEVEFADDGELYVGMMPRSLKALDVLRDPRVALHCPTVDPPEDAPATWAGEGKLAGRAVEVDAGGQPGHRFRIVVDEVVHTRVAPSGDHLLIVSWHPGRGRQERQRF